jgi:hypothetical protein
LGPIEFFHGSGEIAARLEFFGRTNREVGLEICVRRIELRGLSHDLSLVLCHRDTGDGDGEQGKAADGMSQTEGENPDQHLAEA